MNRAGTDPDWGALFSVALLLQTPKGRCYALDEVRGWLHTAGFSGIQGPFRSSPLAFDPDSVLITKKSRIAKNGAGEDHELSRKRWTERLQPRCIEEAEPPGLSTI